MLIEHTGNHVTLHKSETVKSGGPVMYHIPLVNKIFKKGHSE